jgi:hypothetical protein
VENVTVGMRVEIVDEFGQKRIGTVISTEQYGTPGDIGVDTGGYGIYVRRIAEIKCREECGLEDLPDVRQVEQRLTDQEVVYAD